MLLSLLKNKSQLLLLFCYIPVLSLSSCLDPKSRLPIPLLLLLLLLFQCYTFTDPVQPSPPDLARILTFCLTFLKSSTFSFGSLLMVYNLLKHREAQQQESLMGAQALASVPLDGIRMLCLSCGAYV
jgi:hypothetical protein